MRAWAFTSRGPPSEVLQLRHDLPQPQAQDLKPDEVIVKVSHVALFGPSSRLMSVLPHFNDDPWIACNLFAGTITAVGDGGDEDQKDSLRTGTAVFGMLTNGAYFKYNGTLADYIVVPRTCITVKPPQAKFEEVAGLAGNGCTVVGLAERANLLRIEDTTSRPQIQSTATGKKILVTGGSTATGALLLQLVKHLVGGSGEVVTTASPRNHHKVRQLGADTVIDYTRHRQLHRHLITHHSTTPFDAIFDITGTDPHLYTHSPSYLKTSSPFVFAGSMTVTHANPGASIPHQALWLTKLIAQVLGWQIATHRPVWLGGVPRHSFFHSGDVSPRNLEVTRQLVEQGILTGVVDSVWDMEDALAAFTRLMDGDGVCGKIVVRVAA